MVNGQVTPDVIFRGPTPGDLTGPYMSQFLLKPVPMGASTLTQLYRTAIAGDDYWTSYADWLTGQRGGASGSNKFDSTLRYIRNGRDLALYLLVDWSGQANVMAALGGLVGPGKRDGCAHTEQLRDGGTRGIESVFAFDDTGGTNHVWSSGANRPGQPGAQSGKPGVLVPEVARAPAAAAGGVRGTDSQSRDGRGEVSDSL
jgi:hypothetical protein